MDSRRFTSIRHATLLALGISTTSLHAQFSGYVNHGLVGVGRISGNSFDQLGPGVDTLGGIFSSMSVVQSSVQYNHGTFSGTLLGLPDRGFGDGAQDYHPRIQTLDFSFTPDRSGGPLPQTQIQLKNVATTIFKDASGNPFTGFNPSSSLQNAPQSAPGSLGKGHFSLDAEGIVRLRDGSMIVSDEYGPSLYKFNANGEYQGSYGVPEAYIPKSGATVPRPNNFDGNATPDSGRRGNRGLEGLTVSPDETRLFTMLQSPLLQDNGNANASRNTRILAYDIEVGSPTEGKLVGEYIYQLTLNSNTGGTRHTPISEILALNDHQLMVLERDNIGLGGNNGASLYKKVNLADLDFATNLLGVPGMAYDLENGALGQIDLPGTGTTLPGGIIPAFRKDFVNLIDPFQLGKFSLTSDATRTANSLSEKWEGLGLIEALDTPAKNDFYLFVGNDNDFLTSEIYHNGVKVGSSQTPSDNMVLAYHVTMPGARTQEVPDHVSLGWMLAGLATGLGWMRSKFQGPSRH